MAGSVNKVILIGNLGRDPEVRQNQDGSKIITLSIATSESWKDKATAEKKERTEWHRVVVFNEKLGEVCEKYLKKGSKVYLEGQLQTRKWTDQHGIEKYSTEVVLGKFQGNITMLDSRNDDESRDGFGGMGALKPGNGINDFIPSSGVAFPKRDFTYVGPELNDEVPF